MNENEKKVENVQEKKVEDEKVNQTTVQPSSPSNETPSSQDSVSVSSKPPKESKAKMIFAFLLFLAFFALVYFLPDISEEIHKLQEGKKKIEQPKEVTSGVMTCKLSKEVDTRTTSATIQLRFQKEKLKSTVTETITSFNEDATSKDIDTLSELSNSCLLLKNVTEEVDGMSANCTDTEKTHRTVQTVDYETLDLDKIQENITEFEGFYPEFQLDQDINEIQSLLQSSGYNCEKE